MAPNVKEDKFTLYWIDESRTHRILWLLELLQLNYTVEVHLRNPQTWRCTTLFDVHPLGKGPILNIEFADGDEPLQLVESGLIIQYLLANYDPHNIINVTDPRERLRVDYYLHYSEGTLQHLQISLLINSVAKKIAPFGLKSVAKIVSRGLNNGYYIHEWRLNMDYLESQLKKEGTGFFVGKKYTGADIILSFPVMENVFDNEEGVKEITGDKRNLYKLYPNLAAWSDRVKRDPAYQRITELTEQLITEKFGRK